VYPDYWADYVKVIPDAERHDFVSAFYKRLTGTDEVARMAAAKAWSVWEGLCATLKPNGNVVDHFSDPHVAMALARIECHYFYHQSFMRPNQLVEEAYRLADIPGVIIHGRYDMVCPLDNAFALHQAWPQAELQIVRDAGHAAAEPGIIDALGAEPPMSLRDGSVSGKPESISFRQRDDAFPLTGQKTGQPQTAATSE
jgi:proline iminopeptidase